LSWKLRANHSGRLSEVSMRSMWPFLDLCTLYLSVTDYLNARTLSTTADPYRYWKEADSSRDLLKPLVLKYHSAPLGSLESECLWPTANQILTPLRKQLTGEKLKCCYICIIIYRFYNLIINFILILLHYC
jgi:hypothetical protein